MGSDVTGTAANGSLRISPGPAVLVRHFTIISSESDFAGGLIQPWGGLHFSVKEDLWEKKHLDVQFNSDRNKLSFPLTQTPYHLIIITLSPRSMTGLTMLILFSVASVAQSELIFSPGAGRLIRVEHTPGVRGPRSDKLVLSSSRSNVKRNVKTRPWDRVCNGLAHHYHHHHHQPPDNFFGAKSC